MTPHAEHRPKLLKSLKIFNIFALMLLASCAARTTEPAAPEAEHYYEPDLDGADLQTSVAGGGGHGDAALTPVLVRRAPSSSGSLEGDVAGRIIFGHADRLASCYEAVGGAAAGRGVVYLILDVEPQGQVRQAMVGHTDVHQPRFESCLVEELGNLRMPPSADRAVIQAHLLFGARDEDEGRAMLRAYRASRAASGGPDLGTETRIRLSDVGRRVQRCYERTFRGHFNDPGRFVVALTIADGGQVSSVDVIEESLDGRLDECVQDELENVMLEDDGDLPPRILYPVILHPGHHVTARR